MTSLKVTVRCGWCGEQRNYTRIRLAKGTCRACERLLHESTRRQASDSFAQAEKRRVGERVRSILIKGPRDGRARRQAAWGEGGR